MMAIRPMFVSVSKVKPRSTDQLTGYGQWEYNVQANNAESQGTEGTKTRLGFAGLKFADYGSFDYGRNYGVAYDWKAGQICCQSSVAILTTYTDNS